MGNHQKTSLVLVWCCLRALAVIVEHHPVLEGSSTTLVCTGNASGDRGLLYWRKVLPDTTYVPIANCYSTDRYLCSKTFLGYRATYTSSNGTFSSSLTVPVSTNDRNTAYNCSLFIYNEDSSRFIRTWNFSRNYHPAEYAACYVRRLDFLNMSINCSIQNIYPGLICEVFEINEDNSSVVEESLVQNVTVNINASGYRSGFCYVNRQITHPGTYKYRVKIYPDVTLKNVANAVIEKHTNQVVISPTVEIQQPCPGNSKGLVFTCKAFWLQSKPNFMWYVDNAVVRETNSSVIVINGTTHFVSHIELSVNTSQNGRQIKCKARNWHQTLTKETKIISHLFPPPQPPQFSKNDNIIMGSFLTVPEEEEAEQMDMFTCKAMGNTENITGVRVTCTSDTKTLINIDGYTASISFNINYTLVRNSVYCVCSVLYTTECEFLNQFTISKLTKSSPWQRFNTTEAIVYIAAGFVLLIVFTLLLGTWMFLRNHWSELYTYLYSKYYVSTSINTGLIDGIYTCVPGGLKQTCSSSACTQSPSGLDIETEEGFMSSEMTHTVRNNSQLIDEYSESGCFEDLEGIPPRLPPRDPLSSVTTIPLTLNRHASHTTKPEVCNLNLTDDGYLKPLSRQVQYVTRNTKPLRRHHERGTYELNQSEYNPAANYIQVLPDLPPRCPLLAGQPKNDAPPLGHTSGFLQGKFALPPRQPLQTSVVNARTETAPIHSNIPNRRNWTNT